MWAAVQNNTKLTDSASGFAKMDEIDLLKKSLYSGDPPLADGYYLEFSTTQEMRESEAQKEVQNLDNSYGRGMYHNCIEAHFGGVPFGRACLMRVFACNAVKGHSDVEAYRIAVATQFHDDSANSNASKMRESDQSMVSFVKSADYRSAAATNKTVATIHKMDLVLNF